MTLHWRNTVPVGEILRNKLFIPDYQREYAWEGEQVRDFLDDLDGFIEAGEDDYLFGQIILHKDRKTERTYVIDGQQRLATSVIFLAVVRDIVQKLDIDINEKTRFIISSIENHVGREAVGFNLTLNGRNKDFFKKNIQIEGHPEARPKPRTNKNIIRAYQEIEDYLEELTERISDEFVKFTLLSEYTSKFMERFYVSEISTDELSQAFIVFETLNSRGKDLEAADLLKNHFFQEYSSDIDFVKDNWVSMISKIDDARGSTTKYIRYYWNSYNPFVREKGLYRSISKNIVGKPKAAEFLDGLFELSECYIAMVKPTSDIYDAEIMKIFKSLNKMGVSLFYPLALALFRTKKSDEEIKSVLTAVDTLIFRNIIVGPETANKYEEDFSRYAKEISEGKKNPDELRVEIQSRTFDDIKFENYFEEFEAKENIARYVIGEIYDYENKDSAVGDNTKTVNVEHIMPKTLSNKWPHITKEMHEGYLYYVGNQTVLLASSNIKASNDPLPIKKVKYAESGIRQNREYFENIDQWDVDHIKIRQAALFETAKKRWSI